MTPTSFRSRTARIHGHDVSYRMAGEGPVVVLIHGIAGSCPEPARRKTSEARWVGGRIVVLLPAHLRGEARQSTIKWLVDPNLV